LARFKPWNKESLPFPTNRASLDLSRRVFPEVGPEVTENGAGIDLSLPGGFGKA
jgi:hypothetical protein